MNEDTVFKALADESRRTLLDALFHQNGQTLQELCEYLPMSRYGVMKHLSILEDANLITTRKDGRSKHHYLNPVPIQQVYDRWVSKYAQPIARQLTGLKQLLEEAPMTHVFQIFIRTTPERLWQAITQGDFTRQYYMNTAVESSWEVGAPYTYNDENDHHMIEGTVVESDPPHRLVTTFDALWVEPDKRPPLSRVTYEIEPRGDTCKLTVTHDDLQADAELLASMTEGWNMILSGLKSLLETGDPLVIG
jgi:uncharacterized protein YndB with AHSA1/START domain